MPEPKEPRDTVIAALSALKQHHAWHQQIGTVMTPVADHGPVELDLSAEYADSSLCEVTMDAMDRLKAFLGDPMSASMMMYCVPRCRLTKKRCDKLVAMVYELDGGDADMLAAELGLGLARDPDDIGVAFRLALDKLAALDEGHSEANWFRLPGMPYTAWATGGMSSVDPPTELYSLFGVFTSADVILNQLTKWATKDTEKGRA